MNQSPVAAACAAVLIACAAGSAHAAIYTGTFDPENANYKWFGNHVFSVDNACLQSAGWKWVYNSAPNDDYYCGGVQLTGGDLTLTNKMGTPSTGDDVTATINFTDFPSLVPNSNKIWGIFVKYNEGSSSFELAGVDTDLVGAFTFVEPELSGDWFVRWESGKAPNSYSWLWSSRPGYTYTQALLDPVYLSNAATGCVPGPTTCTPFQVTGPATTVTFSRVPEPASSGLVLAALGAAWWAGRRRRPA